MPVPGTIGKYTIGTDELHVAPHRPHAQFSGVVAIAAGTNCAATLAACDGDGVSERLRVLDSDGDAVGVAVADGVVEAAIEERGNAPVNARSQCRPKLPNSLPEPSTISVYVPAGSEVRNISDGGQYCIGL